VEKIAQYCQKCRAANEPGEYACWRCGTRLMLVVVPPSVRHEDTLLPSYYEDHLLERVSLLELRMSQIAERLSMALDLMLRQAKTIQADHLLIETLLDTLTLAGVFEKDKVTKSWREKLKEEDLRLTDENYRDAVLREILARHDRPNIELFTNLVREGMNFLNEGEEKQGLRTLERAAQLSPRNVPLLAYLAENLFRADKFEAAKKHLESAAELAPQEPKISLLLGVICADEGDAENARKYLSLLADRRETAFCVNFAWTFLAAAEENWTETLAASKETLRAKDAPETQYLAACAYFQLERYKMAQKHLQKAVEADAKFSDAWFMLGVVFEILGNKAKAAEATEKAWLTKEAGAQSLEFLKRGSHAEIETALPFLRLKQRRKNLLTAASRRLSRIFREELFKLL
jgi:Flp pilus assembly protein TadD